MSDSSASSNRNQGPNERYRFTFEIEIRMGGQVALPRRDLVVVELGISPQMGEVAWAPKMASRMLP